MNNDKKINKIIFFFFPYYHTGGAEKVHLQIVKCFSDRKCIVFFTDRSRDNKNKKEFKKYALCFDFFGINNKIKIFEKLFIWIIAFFINRFSDSIVFGSNSRFFYSLVDKLDESVKTIDLVHWFDGQVGEAIINKTKRIDKRIIITPALRNLLKVKYRDKRIDKRYLNRIKIIENCITIPPKVTKEYNSKLRILYIGRNSYEKRVNLAFEVWNRVGNELSVDFLFIGRGLKKAFRKSFGGIQGNNITVINNIYNDGELNDLYNQAHIIFLTSIFEGFPMVFMEAMSYGVVPISTVVGGIPVHLNKNNSILIFNKNDQGIVTEISNAIKYLDSNRTLLKILSANARFYAQNHFSCVKFCDKYKKEIDEFIR